MKITDMQELTLNNIDVQLHEAPEICEEIRLSIRNQVRYQMERYNKKQNRDPNHITVKQHPDFIRYTYALYEGDFYALADLHVGLEDYLRTLDDPCIVPVRFFSDYLSRYINRVVKPNLISRTLEHYSKTSTKWYSETTPRKIDGKSTRTYDIEWINGPFCA